MTVLLVCSGGGHLKELHQLVPRFGLGDEPRLWVTFDSGLSRDLLADEEVVHIRHAVPRDAVSTSVHLVAAAALLSRRRFSAAISSGASPGVAYLAQAAARGVPSHYVELIARVAGPSLSGRILARVPGVSTYTQHSRWVAGSWAYRGSVLDSFAVGPRRPARVLRRAVVSLGTAESYGFRRLVAVLAPMLAGYDEVLWQTGSTDVAGLGVDGRCTVPHDELSAAVAEADVVVSHAGSGASLTALEHGHRPVLVPRRAHRGEHVDDHQTQIAHELSRRGLAVHREVEDLDAAALDEAASCGVARVAPPPFALCGTRSAV